MPSHEPRIVLTCFVCCCLLSSRLPKAGADGPADQAAISLADNLKDPDPNVVRSGMQEIAAELESDPDRSVSYARRFWIKALMDAGHLEEVDSLALQAILAAPSKTGDVAYLQEARVRAAMAKGHPQEALVLAKGLFNVCQIRDTEKALMLVAECVSACDPGHGDAVKRLFREQRAGAATRPFVAESAAPPPPRLFGQEVTAAATSPARGLLNEIALDSSPYEKAMGDLVSDDEKTLIGKGNLLLLAGRADQAEVIFERLVLTSEPKDRLRNREHVARAIRAQDGTIGRANGYLVATPVEER